MESVKVWYIKEQWACSECCSDEYDDRLFADTDDGKLLLLGAIQHMAELKTWSTTDPHIDLEPNDDGWKVTISCTSVRQFGRYAGEERAVTEEYYLCTRTVLG